jgi:hypothetical protein
MDEPKKASGSDVLTLNVGGKETVQTLRSTLTIVPGSKLAEMFSGRWDKSLPKDKDGNFFIDRMPEIFCPLLDFLRDLSTETLPDWEAIPPVTPTLSNHKQESTFRRMVDGYNLTNALYNYEIYLYGRSAATCHSGRLMMTHSVSVLDFVMQNDQDYFTPFRLDRPSSRLGDCHRRNIQAFEISITAGFRGYIGWIPRESVSPVTASKLLPSETKLILVRPGVAIFMYCDGDGNSEVEILDLQYRNDCVIRCSKHADTAELSWHLNGAFVAVTCHDARSDSIAALNDDEAGQSFCFQWSGPHSNYDLVPSVGVQNGNCQFCAIELETS